MRTELFMYFCIKKYIGTQGEVCRQLNYFTPPPPVVYATDLYKAVVPVLVLFCVVLWFLPLALHFLKSYRALCPPVSSFLLALWSPRCGKRELVWVLFVHFFVCFLRVNLFMFFFSSCCRGLAAVCDCGTLWTFLLTFVHANLKRQHTNTLVFHFQKCIGCRWFWFS